ncbi:carrier superfamily protein [Besnoitia besnoiti]|uniref:Carrier superfamily protein n=1 Tax=Besnoitia besnoiti TaxID=94643 RepID=A0A2A9MLQ9_BESBE|nr:carrier superfamily protein [Besnoitia besnoiti]PFH36420.1 carrier superfamily protein [Besnoitia besnoiti]
MESGSEFCKLGKSLDPGVSYFTDASWANLLAGGCTGLFVDAVLFPLDVFKTRKQAETSRCRQANPSTAFSHPRSSQTGAASGLSAATSAAGTTCTPTSTPTAGSAAAELRSQPSSASSSRSSNTSSASATLFAVSGGAAAHSHAPANSSRQSQPFCASSSSSPSSSSTAGKAGASAQSSSVLSQSPHESQNANGGRGLNSVAALQATRTVASGGCSGFHTGLVAASEATGLNCVLEKRGKIPTAAASSVLRASGAGGQHCSDRPKLATSFFPSRLSGGFGIFSRMIHRYYPGFGALAVGTFPSSALFFVTYEGSKQFLAKQEAGQRLSPALTYVVCSTVAEFASCCVRTPFEMLKQQMQLGMHLTTTGAIQAIWRRDGWQGFFVGFNATIVRDLPFVGVEMALWEYLKKYFCSMPGVSDSAALTSISSGLAGLLAGGGAAVATTPLDVVKTRLMTQEEGRYQYRGYFDCFSSILRREGPGALFLGLKLRVIWVALGGALFFGGYDAFKSIYLRMLTGKRSALPNTAGYSSSTKGDTGFGVGVAGEALRVEGELNATEGRAAVATLAAETQE